MVYGRQSPTNEMMFKKNIMLGLLIEMGSMFTFEITNMFPNKNNSKRFQLWRWKTQSPQMKSLQASNQKKKGD